MAQNAPPADPDPPRPLPRRPVPRPQPARAQSRPRFQPLDAVWMAFLTALALAVLTETTGLTTTLVTGPISAAIVAALYLLGWRARDRAAGAAAGLLAATSLPFLQTVLHEPLSAVFTLLTILALFAFVAGSSLAALALAAVATLIRPDGLLLGLLLLGLSFAQQRRRALLGAAIFLAPVLAAWGGRTAMGHGALLLPAVGFHAGSCLWLWQPSSLLLAWFLLPLCAEMSEPMRRARWLPVLSWAAVYLASASLLSFGSSDAMRVPLMPLLLALAGGGLSRLLPTLSGEFPGPAPRYILATLAVVALVGLYLRLQMPVSVSAAPGHHSR